MTEIEKAQKSIAKCKYKIITKADHTFIMSIMFNMKFEWNSEVPTAATDGLTIYINPTFWLSLDLRFQTFLLIHETYHVVFKHCIRAAKNTHLDHKKMNAAEDFMINLIIHDEMGWHPEECLYDDKYRGMSSMEIYRSFPPDLPPPEANDVQPQVSAGDGGKPDKGELVEIEAQIDGMLITAAVAHEKKTGMKPGITGEGNSLGRYLEDLMNPAINWLPIARKHLTKYVKERLSMNKPNRRYLAHKMVMPSRSGKGMEDICVFADSSGSVTPKELREYVAFVRTMHKQLKPEKLYVRSFDHQLHEQFVYRKRDKIPAITLEGGGGTDIQKVINNCEEINPRLVIVFTDGWFYPPQQQSVDFDLVWIILDNPQFTCHIGRVIHHITK